jgi:hypothetical protein
VDQANDREHHDRHQDKDSHQVLEESQPRPLPHEGQVEVAHEQCAVAFDQREHEQDEAPERENVGDSWNRPRQELALP